MSTDDPSADIHSHECNAYCRPPVHCSLIRSTPELEANLIEGVTIEQAMYGVPEALQAYRGTVIVRVEPARELPNPDLRTQTRPWLVWWRPSDPA